MHVSTAEESLVARSRETLLLEACTESGTIDGSVSEQVVPKGLAVHRHGLPSSFQPLGWHGGEIRGLEPLDATSRAKEEEQEVLRIVSKVKT